MSFHENRLPADDSHEYHIMPYLLFMKNLQNLKLSSANYRKKAILYKRLFEMDILASVHCSLRINFNPSAPGKF